MKERCEAEAPFEQNAEWLWLVKYGTFNQGANDTCAFEQLLQMEAANGAGNELGADLPAKRSAFVLHFAVQIANWRWQGSGPAVSSFSAAIQTSSQVVSA